jgi:hypothetical protein
MGQFKVPVMKAQSHILPTSTHRGSGVCCGFVCLFSADLYLRSSFLRKNKATYHTGGCHSNQKAFLDSSCSTRGH